MWSAHDIFVFMAFCTDLSQDGYYGLSEDAYGCKYCDCDPGGAYNNSCSSSNGQCYCRDNIEGRRCDRVRSGYFYMFMDYFTYEAEESYFITPDVSSVARIE